MAETRVGAAARILTPEAVHDLVRACLSDEGRWPAEPASVEGIVRTFCFDDAATRAKQPDIERLIGELPPEFLKGQGGGWTFLNLCRDRHGTLWTGLHADMEALCCLCIAAGRARWLMQREMWSALPGSVPYVVFWTGEPAAAEGR